MVTMMSKTAQQVKELTNIIRPLINKVVALNHSETKYNYFSTSGYRHGVESDHIKIFELASVKKSFAFSYYFNKTKEPFVIVNLKDGDKFTGMAKYSEPAFRQKLNNFLPLLHSLKSSETLNQKSLESLFVAHFIKNNEYNQNGDFERSFDQVKAKLTSSKEKRLNSLAAKESLQEEMAAINKEIKTKIELKKKELKIQELKSKLAKAEKALSAYSDQTRKDLNYSQKREKLNQLDHSIYVYDSEAEETVNESFKGLGQKELIKRLTLATKKWMEQK
jgi:hypothetical protein